MKSITRTVARKRVNGTKDRLINITRISSHASFDSFLSHEWFAMDYQRGYRIPIRIPRGVCIDIQTRVGETEISLAAFRSRFFLLFSNLTTLSSRVVGHLFERQGEEGGLKRELPSFLSFFRRSACEIPRAWAAWRMGVQKEIFLSRDPQSLRDKDIPVSLVCVYISNKEESFSFSKKKLC